MISSEDSVELCITSTDISPAMNVVKSLAKSQCQATSLDSVLTDTKVTDKKLTSEPDTRKIETSKTNFPPINGPSIPLQDDPSDCTELQDDENPNLDVVEKDKKDIRKLGCTKLALRMKTVVPPPIEVIMDPSIIEMMSSALTEVIMHSELTRGQILHMSSDHSTRRNPKRNQNCVSRTLSLNLETPTKKPSEVDGSSNNDTIDGREIRDGEEGGEEDEEEEEDVFLSLTEAIMCKYLRTVSNVLDDNSFSSTIMIITPPRNPCLPATLVLNDCDICCVGDLEQIKSMCYQVRELDLAQNRLTDLVELYKIMSLMNHLTFLNLSSNNFSSCLVGNFPDNDLAMEAMKWLVLNGTYMPWDAVEVILACMPNLEELYLSLNSYSSINMDPNKQMNSIHLIHISGNPINNWDDVMRLGMKFPNLETLVMADCHMAIIQKHECIAQVFEKLQSLNISNNRINSWEEIDKLRFFPSLGDLRLLGQPLLERYNQQERRQLMIGRLPNVDRLNGSRISDEEREDAERAFIRYYMQKPASEKPRRFDELVEKHGHLDPLANVDLRPKKVVQVVVVYEEKREVRQINVQQTVGQLKTSFQNFVGFPTNQMRLWYVDKEIGAFTGPEELRFNTKMVYTLNVQDGDEFHIMKK